MGAAARDLTPPGRGTVILEALTDLWVNVLIPTPDHPFAGTASESITALVNLKLDAQALKAEHPECAGRGDDFVRVFSLSLAMLEATLQNYPRAMPGDYLREVSALVAEGTNPSIATERTHEIQSRCYALLEQNGLSHGQAELVLRDVRLALLQRNVHLRAETD